MKYLLHTQISKSFYFDTSCIHICSRELPVTVRFFLQQICLLVGFAHIENSLWVSEKEIRVTASVGQRWANTTTNFYINSSRFQNLLSSVEEKYCIWSQLAVMKRRKAVSPLRHMTGVHVVGSLLLLCHFAPLARISLMCLSSHLHFVLLQQFVLSTQSRRLRGKKMNIKKVHIQL